MRDCCGSWDLHLRLAVRVLVLHICLQNTAWQTQSTSACSWPGDIHWSASACAYSQSAFLIHYPFVVLFKSKLALYQSVYMKKAQLSWTTLRAKGWNFQWWNKGPITNHHHDNAHCKYRNSILSMNGLLLHDIISDRNFSQNKNNGHLLPDNFIKQKQGTETFSR